MDEKELQLNAIAQPGQLSTVPQHMQEHSHQSTTTPQVPAAVTDNHGTSDLSAKAGYISPSNGPQLIPTCAAPMTNGGNEMLPPHLAQTSTNYAAVAAPVATGTENLEASTAVSASKRRKTSISGGQGQSSNGADKPWNDMLFELLKFRAVHQHCAVPRGSELGRWVISQRSSYHSFKRNGKKRKYSGSLNEERIAVLNSLGFVWSTLIDANEEKWEKRYEELIQYKREHGDCNAPQKTPLGKWVKMQRENKHEADLRKAGKGPSRSKAACLSDERRLKLEAIGFQWRVSKEPVGWENRFKQLVEYGKEHGHVNVPQAYPKDKPFGRWVMKQRCEYHNKLKGEKSQMTDERIQKLNSIGFAWVAPHIQKRKAAAFVPAAAPVELPVPQLHVPQPDTDQLAWTL